jgi:WD40 repeat protein
MNAAMRPAVRVLRAPVDEQHEGEVRDAVWAADMAVAATAGADGTIKLWHANLLKCLWTARKKPALVQIPYTKVALDVAHDIVVGGLADGEIMVWSGVRGSNGKEVRIPPLQADPEAAPEAKEITSLFIDATSSDRCAILAVHANDVLFYRLDVDFAAGTYTRTAFGDGASGLVTAIVPSFARIPEERSFVVTGDTLGCVRLFAWCAVPGGTADAQRMLEAHAEGDAVTCLALGAHVLAAGSARGAVRVLDALSLAPLRTIAPPHTGTRAPPEPVSHVALQRELLVAAIGTRVVAWKAAPVENRIGKHVQKSTNKWRREGATKGQRERTVSGAR